MNCVSITMRDSLLNFYSKLNRLSKLDNYPDILRNLEISETSNQAANGRKRTTKALRRAIHEARTKRRRGTGLFRSRSRFLWRGAGLIGRLIGRWIRSSRILRRIGKNHRLGEVRRHIATEQVAAARPRLRVVS